MELPIFSDNLKSSGSWAALLAHEREAWVKMPRDLPRKLVRERQVDELLLHAGQGIDRRRLLEAAEKISGWAAEAEGKFSLGRLLELHRTLTGVSPDEDVFRKSEPLSISAKHDPAPAVILPRMLDNAFDWFSTDSFNELHPVERASIVYLRLLDLHPFPVGTEATALLAASFYTEKAGFPPLIIYTDEMTLARYDNVLDAAFGMLTQPLVELFAEMLRRTMRVGREDVQ
jgi:Fic family protein